MPPEGPNKTEELLQRYARERREQGGDFPLHPATRRLLQGEVARRFGGRAREKSRGRAWFGTWRGRLVFAATTAAIVASTWLVWNGSRTEPGFELAKNDRLADLAQLAAEPALRPAPADELAAVDKKLAADYSLGLEEKVGREKQKAAGLATVTVSESLTPGRNYSMDVGRPALFSGALITNAADYYAFITPQPSANSKLSTPGLLATESSLFGGAGLANARGFAPGGPLTLTDEVRDGAVRFGASSTAGLPGQGTISYDIAAVRPLVELSYQNGAAPAYNGPAVRAEITKTQTEGRSLALGGAEPRGLTRERKLNEDELARAPAPVAPQNVPVDALALNRNLADANTAPERFGEVAATLGASVRADANAGSTVFFRQSGLDLAQSLAEVDRRAVTLLKKAESESIAPEVLSRFVVEQSGQAIRLVDADGSLYEGAITTQAAGAASGFESAGQRDKDRQVSEQTVALKAAAPRRGQEYSFRAAGSNVTLRQLVIVNGRLNAAPDPALEVSSGVAGGTALAGTTTAAAPIASPSPARRAQAPAESGRGGGYGLATNSTVTIEGTVRVGGAGEQQFKAVRAPR